MSSHHFVKEDQEPALLIIDPDAIPFEKIQELLEWSPLVIVAQRAMEKVLGWGIKIDVVLTSHHDEAFRQVVMDQSPIQVLTSRPAENDLNAICKFLTDRKQNNLNVITADAQEYFAATALISEINVVLFDSTARWLFILNGSYSKWFPAETPIQTFINGNLEKTDVRKAGVFKIERKESFWVGESY